MGEVDEAVSFFAVYSIASMIGIGAKFISEAGYLAIGFAQHTLEREQANDFVMLGPYVSTLLAMYDGRGVLWS